MTAKHVDDSNGMEEAEVFIRQQMERNDEKLRDMTDIDCKGFDALRETTMLQHDTDRYLLSTLRSTRKKVIKIDEDLSEVAATTKDTSSTVKLLLAEVRKSNGSSKPPKHTPARFDGKTIAKGKLPIIGEFDLQGFRANDIILILLILGLLVIGWKAWSTDGAPKGDSVATEEHVHGKTIPE